MSHSLEYEQALDFSLSILKHNDDVTDEVIRATVDLAIKMVSLQGNADNVDLEALSRDLQSRFNVRIGTGTILDGNDRRDWLPEKRDHIEWSFWKRYERYLREEKHWSPRIIRRVDELTDKVLERLEDPIRSGSWDRRGMVAGQVQSGKTANYTGLICKAADAGYRLIVVLAGMHNNLRSQTQLRLDEGFLGYNTRYRMTFDQSNLRVGVGALRGEKLHPVQSLTHSEDAGDFKLTIAKHSSIDLSAVPLLLVVKKQGSILRNLNRWLTGRYGEKDTKTQRLIIHDVPLLLIDDECDNASINTRDEDTNPTTINARIRELLHSFAQSSYVGYTATPFANIFINLNTSTEQHGDELFPRDFIINLPAPDNYIGPVRFFGLSADPEAGLEAQTGLPVIRYVEDYEDWIADKHKTDYVPGILPFSLKKALKSFIISCAVRMARGQEREHNSMLVHVTRFTEVQNKVRTQIDQEVRSLRQRLRYGDGASPDHLISELERLWNEDFVPTTEAIDDPEVPKNTWQEIKVYLEPAIQKIQVKTINGKAKDLLDYVENLDGLNVIAIGGDKLSRGLTLEGLTISYYLRASKMYDTLMQMGRWFGYRPKYLDLCRLYTTDELVEWYKHITVASEELRQEFDYMAMLDKTPAEFGLKVRTHPAGLAISNVGKIRDGKTLRVSYAGSISETVAFYKDPLKNRRNLEKFAQFLEECGKPNVAPTASSGDDYIWNNIHGTDIVKLLKNVETHRDSLRANSKLLADYINAQLAKDELRSWTVVLKSKRNFKPGETPIYGNIGEYKTGLYTRKSSKASNLDRYSIQRLVSPVDEGIDLSEEVRKRLREEMKQENGTAQKQVVEGEPSNPFRRERSPDRGLLLIYPLDPQDAGWSSEPPILGFAISFPGSTNASSVEYRVNNVYYSEEFGDEKEE
ncbi:Z1 domain-containing protein [Stenomitos frigidus]|uniref:Endonuclease n=1 Tax=Stenomitos frigidus ULC18 TaxID=2107698 RepID=A0A2T1EM15_9CYAN|nr:Z1 domain-containing protein [Stenomitos frigidus]PSB33718.1 endonuclease [Stenomitos frigidus ULC18]